MNKFVVATIVALFASSVLYAKNEVQYFDLNSALQSADFKRHLNDNITFKFGSNSGQGEKIIVSGVSTRQKANGVGKTDEAACRRALLNALIRFQKRALKEGGTKVVNLTGFYANQPYDSTERFQCGVGNVVSGVALKGDIAK